MPQNAVFDSSDGGGLSYERVVSGAPDALLVVDHVGTIRYANDRALELFACTRAALTGRPVADFLPARSGRGPADPGVAHGRRCDGRQVPVVVSRAALDDGHEVITARPVDGPALTETDIAAWLRLERLLLDAATALISAPEHELDGRMSDALARLTRDAGADHAVLYEVEADELVLRAEWSRGDVDAGFGSVERIERRSFTWARDRLTQGRYQYIQSVADLPPEAGAERRFMEVAGIRSAVAVPLGTGDDYLGVLSLRWLRAEAAWTPGTSTLLEMFGDTLLAALRRQRAERELARSHQRFRTALTAAPVGVAFLDHRGRFEWVNDVLAGMAGRPAAELAGAPLASVTHADDVARVERAVVELAGDGGRAHLRARLLSPGGGTTWVDISSAQVDGGTAAYTVAFVRDVSAAVSAERALQQAYERERAAAERLRASDRMKDEFVATAAHELRTPVTPIAGMAHHLLERWDTLTEDRKLEIVERIAANADDMRRLVDELLEFSRLEVGTFSVDRRPVGVGTAVRALTRRLGPSLADHRVVTSVPPTLTVDADPLALDRILTNLVSNAVKFSPPGSAVAISARAAGETVVIEVADKGAGIPAEDLEHVFDRFYQGANRSMGRGVGIGLSIVDHYVRLHGGEVSVTSAPGKGSTFRVALRRAAELNAEPEHTGGRALVVDDEGDIRFMLRLLLEDRRWHVTEASTGAQALALLGGPDRPDLVLLDVRMPDLDAWAVLERLQADGLMPGLRVVLLTAWAEPEARERALAAGCEDLLHKPVTAAQLDGLLHG